MADRRAFSLPAHDQDFLDSSGLRWATLREGNSHWLIVYGLAVLPGYGVAAVDVALPIEANYPDAQIDMAYFFPALVRSDGKAIPNADSPTSIDGRVWQRWSRHRTGDNPWVPGVDCVETHLDLVRDWLSREFERRP